MRKLALAGGIVAMLAFSGSAAAQDAFPAGSLIVPMDIDNQDTGMLRAFGLVYKLLLNDVPVAWCIRPGKSLYTGSTRNPTNAADAVDFMAATRDVRTGVTMGTVGYRGGPFVIDAAHKTRALSIVSAWNTGQSNVVTVHEATAGFDAFVDRVLVNAPNIGINADGNEPIAYGYLNAAGIPDSLGNAWSGTSPDVMTPAEIAGPTTTDQRDGRLWGPTQLPRYCQLMSMHWSVSRDAISNEAIAEMSEYLLNYPVHLFAECQAVNMLEDAPAGHFVSTDNGTGTPTKSLACGSTTTPNNGLCAKKPTPSPPLEFLNSHLPFAQLDGPFRAVGGSEPAYGLAPGSTYYDQGIVMIREQNVAGGVNGKADIWMTGFANFAGSICTIGEGGIICESRGKVSYLGGHQYSTNVPISTNGETQGTRLFLNSLFEAECVAARGAANVEVSANAPAYTTEPLVTLRLDWNNVGAGVAVTARLTDTLPAGVTFVSASDGGVFSSGTVRWDLGDIAPGAAGSVSVTVSLPSYGSYSNSGSVGYKVGNNSKTGVSNTTTTVYAAELPDAGTQPDGGGNTCATVTCPGPVPADPCKMGACNPVSGSCDIVAVANGTPCDDGNVCTTGSVCTAGICGGGVPAQCAPPANPCQTATCVVGQGCVAMNLGNGAACSTGDMCVIGQSCIDGVCSGGSTRACFGSASPCQVPICNPATGCGFVPGNSGAACDDGDACTTGTTCAGGLCQGGAVCPAAAGPCRVGVCGANGCETTFTAAGTDPRGDCPAIGGCARSCDGAGSCTACPITGSGGTDGGAGTGGAAGGSTGSGGTGAGGAGGATAGTGAGTGGSAVAGSGGSGNGGSSGGDGGSGSGGASTGGAGGGAAGAVGPGSGGAPTSGTGGSGTGGGTTSGGGGTASGRGGSADGGAATGGSSASASASGCGCEIGLARGGAAPVEALFAGLLVFGSAIWRRPGNRRRGSRRGSRQPML